MENKGETRTYSNKNELKKAILVIQIHFGVDTFFQLA